MQHPSQRTGTWITLLGESCSGPVLMRCQANGRSLISSALRIGTSFGTSFRDGFFESGNSAWWER